MAIGFCNVVGAKFVETAMAAAHAMDHQKRTARLQNEALWATSVTTLINRILSESDNRKVKEASSLPESIDDLYNLEIPISVIQSLSKDKLALAALQSLDVELVDAETLGDLLDPDNGGSVRIIEFVEGVNRLRGVPRRGDIISMDLMLRSIQRAMGDLKDELRTFCSQYKTTACEDWAARTTA